MNYYVGIYQRAGTAFEPDFGIEIMAEMENAVFAGQGMGLSMHGSLAHAVTGWGMRLNPFATFTPDPNDKDDVLWNKWNAYLNSYYQGVWISDSDNGPQLTERRNSPNTLNYYDVDWDGSRWTINSYMGGDYISSLTTLDRRDGYNVPTDLTFLNNTVKENRPKGTVVGNLAAVDADTINNTYVYEFIDGPGAGDNSLFSIANGQIRTNAVFDYEKKNSYSVLVRSTDQTGLVTEKALIIRIENVNEQPLAINIAASPFTRWSPIATPVGVLSTIDPDSNASGFGGVFAYQMVAGSGDTDNSLFQITGQQVTLLKDISATTQQTFSIRVKTTDAAGMSFEQVLTIQPSPSSLQIDKGSVNENLPANSLVGNLTANSGLAPFDGELTWSLVDALLPAESADNWQFKIVGNQLLTAIPMNHEAQDTCRIHVRATNQYGWSFQGSLAILVNDLNDAPSALVLTGNVVRPTMSVGTVVGRLFTQDEDELQTFTYALVPGTGSDDNALFTIVGGELRLNQKLTLPLRQAYKVRVRSVDSGTPAAIIEKDFTLNLAGNSAPISVIFTTTTIREDAAIGSLVGTFAGVDPNPGEVLTYSLVAGPGSLNNNLFEVRGDQLHTRSNLDFETNTFYYIRFRVTDSYGEWVENIGQITVTDVAESPVDLTLSNGIFPENQPAGLSIGSFKTIDQDNSGAGPFSYMLVSGQGDGDNSLFEISQGYLRTKGLFDFDSALAARKLIDPTATSVSYSIRVRTVDQTLLGYERTFNLTLTDELDDQPYFLISSNIISENSLAPSPIGVFSPMDPNRVLKYELVVGANDNALFEIDPATGQLSAMQSFNYEARNLYTIRVKATDISGASAHLFNQYETTFPIAVQDANDAPTAINVVARNPISRSLTLVTWVLRLSTTDEDAGDAHTYSLVNGYGSNDNAFFDMLGNEMRLVYSIANQPDRAFSVRIRSTDLRGGTFERLVNIQPSVAPTDIMLSNSTVPENSPINTIVGSLTVADPDINESLTYDLVGGDIASFVLQGSTIRTSEVFDYETRSAYSLTVRVTDKGGWTFTKVIPITVANVVEGPTDITLSSTNIAENQPLGTVVGDLVAVVSPAPAVPVSMQLFDNVAYPDNAAFDIVNGQLVTTAPFNFEAKAAYTIQVRAATGGEVFLKVFTISVVNGNDAPTDIVLGKSSVGENLPAGAVVGTIIGVDADIADVLTYTLSDIDAYPDNAFFAIGTAGKLVTAAEFDYEKKKLYTIQVRATDASGTAFFDKVFQIRIVGANDAPVLFGLNTDEIVRNLRAGDLVCEIGARDEDMGDYFTTSLVAGEGDTDNALFNLNYLELRTKAALPYEHGRSYSVRVGVTDRYGATTSKMFTITCNDPDYVAPAPTFAITTDGRASVTVNLLPNLMRTMSVSQTPLEITQPAHGAAIMGSNGVVTYQAKLGYVGSDLFTYTLDGAVGQVEVKVNIPSVPNVAITGTAGNDRIVLSMVNGILRSTVNDVMQQYLTTDSTTLKVYGLAGNDTILLASSVTRSFFIDGGAGDDVISAGSGNDTIYGGSGNDSLRGNAGADRVLGQSGMDTLIGGAGSDLIYGGTENDFLSGEVGDDSLFGGLHNDIVYGGAGNDRLNGDAGDDKLIGGIGKHSRGRRRHRRHVRR